MITPKQMEIMIVLKDADEDGRVCTVYDLMDALTYETKRDSLLHVMRALITKGYVERKGREKRGPTHTQVTFGLGPNSSEVI